MKLKFLKTNSLSILKENIKDNIKHYSDANSNWIKNSTNDEVNYIESKLDVPDFELIISKTPEKDDFLNIKLLYSNLIELTDSQAGDERLWAGLCHNQFWNYMINRWPIAKAKDEVKFIKKNYFFAHGEKRSLMTNGLARLWWIGRLTYDKDNPNNNPFELTEYLCKDLNGRGFPLFGSNFSNNDKILKIFLYTLKNYEESNNIKLDRNTEFLEMIKYVNKLSGKMLIDYLSNNELRKLILDEVTRIVSLK